MLSQEQMQKLEIWITISEMICKSYNELINAEVMYGRDSREYQRALRDIRIKLDTEKEVSEEILENPILYDNIMFCLENCGGMQNGAFRIKKRLEKDCSLQYDVLLANSVNQFAGNEYSLSRDICNLINEKKIDNLIEVIYLLLGDRKRISLIDKKIGTETDEQKRMMLIDFKNNIISISGDLEQWYFGLGNNVDSYLIDDDEIMARFLEIPVEEYSRRKQNAIKKRVFCVENHFVGKDDSEIEKTRFELSVILRPFISLLPPEEIESLYQEFKKKNQYGFPNLSVRAIESTYRDALEDSREDEKIRRLIPGNS